MHGGVGSATCRASFAERPVRVIVCQWSRTRPVLSRKRERPAGRRGEAGSATAIILALRRACRSLPRRKKKLLRRPARPPRPEEGLHRGVGLIRQLGRGPDVEIARAIVLEGGQRRVLAKDVGRRRLVEAMEPMRRATSAMCSQSGFASPARDRKARWREMRRSELVTVPSFSPQAAAGSSTCAPASVVSVEVRASETTKRSSFLSAARMASARGSVTAGLVCITHSALISPRSIASNICTAFSPRPQPCSARPRSGGRGRSPRARSPYGPPACWRARPPRARPWRWAGR